MALVSLKRTWIKVILVCSLIYSFYWISSSDARAAANTYQVQEKIKSTSPEKISRRLLRQDEHKNTVFAMSAFTKKREADDPTTFLTRPHRILGLLNLRNIQGSTLSGGFMRAAFVTFVHSRPLEKARRDEARRTWSSVRDINGWKFETVFLVNLSSEDKEVRTSDLIAEDILHGDVLVYEEKARVNSQLLTAMEWASKTLPGDFYVAFSEDIYLLNVPLIKEFMLTQRHDIGPHNTVHVIKMNDSYSILSPVPQTIYCFGGVFNDSLVRETGWVGVRHIHDSFHINAVWPIHCNGQIFATSVHMVAVLFQESLTSDGTNIDSTLFVTGVLREKLLRGDGNIVHAMFRDSEFYKSHFKVPQITASGGEERDNLSFKWERWYETIKRQNVIRTKYS